MIFQRGQGYMAIAFQPSYLISNPSNPRTKTHYIVILLFDLKQQHFLPHFNKKTVYIPKCFIPIYMNKTNCNRQLVKLWCPRCAFGTTALMCIGFCQN